jgi:ATP-dependent helicase/DNAse subunit B
LKVRLPLYGQLKQHVSFSEIGQFNDCQWKWVLNKVFGIERVDRSLAMDFGTAVHAGMEFMFGEVGSIKSVEDTLLVARAAFDKKLEGVTLTDTEQQEFAELLDILPRIFTDVLACPDLQDIRPVKSELNLYEDIARTDGLTVKFKGFIDFIFVKKLKTKTVIYIADFKTCKWGWPAKKLQDIRVTAQLLLYKHFFCKLTGADPKNVTAAYILLKKTPRKDDASVEVVKIGSGPKAIQQALDYLQGTITKMHGFEYSKNFEACETRWVDQKTKQERSFCCPFYKQECSGSAEVAAGS